MRLSVVVPTYRRRDSVGALLRSLENQTLPVSQFEVLVSIDGSEDGTLELVEGFIVPFPVRTLWQPNRGRAAACNAGIRASRGEIVVLLDDDMRPAPRCLEEHGRAHPVGSRRCVVGAAPIAVTDATPPLTAYVASNFNTHLQRLGRCGHVFGVRDFYSGNASLPRDVVKAVGLFDESFRRYGNEDLELAVRLRRAGVQLVFAPDAMAEQAYDKQFAALASDTLAKGVTAVQFAVKHPDVLSELRLVQFSQESWRWRFVCMSLLRLTSVLPATPRVLITATTVLERSGLRRLGPYYRLLLDYFYWLGARQGVEESAMAWAAIGGPAIP